VAESQGEGSYAQIPGFAKEHSHVYSIQFHGATLLVLAQVDISPHVDMLGAPVELPIALKPVSRKAKRCVGVGATRRLGR
jgi:hypothetical protein